MATHAQTANSSLVQYYLTDLWNETGDPRVKDYPLMSSFKYPLVIFLVYHLLVHYLLPRFMRNREAYSLKWIIIPYNLLLSLFNLYIFIQLLESTKFKLYDVSFRPTDDTSDTARKDINLAYVYFLSKYVDKLDTIFFLLRKKSSQVTGLHVYHHSMVPLMGWMYFRINAFHVISNTFAFLNSPIHTIMYAYYGLAAFGPHMQPYLWWKRHITMIQILQFVILFAHAVYFTLYQTGFHLCWSIDILVQSLLYLVLFTRFYFKSYTKKKPINGKKSD